LGNFNKKIAAGPLFNWKEHEHKKLLELIAVLLAEIRSQEL
jgi:hypothetical protein